METNGLSTEQILSAVPTLSTPDLEQLFERVLTVQAERKTPHLPAIESALLLRAKQGTPSALGQRFNQLRAKREDCTINDDEYAELTALCDQIEILHAERLQAIAELAQRHNLGLDAMLSQLGIRFPEHG